MCRPGLRRRRATSSRKSRSAMLLTGEGVRPVGGESARRGRPCRRGSRCPSGWRRPRCRAGRPRSRRTGRRGRVRGWRRARSRHRHHEGRRGGDPPSICSCACARRPARAAVGDALDRPHGGGELVDGADAGISQFRALGDTHWRRAARRGWPRSRLRTSRSARRRRSRVAPFNEGWVRPGVRTDDAVQPVASVAVHGAMSAQAVLADGAVAEQQFDGVARAGCRCGPAVRRRRRAAAGR
jgi:hypothetical protein